MTTYGIEGLIKALRILGKYNHEPFPTLCHFSFLLVKDVQECQPTDDERETLKQCGFKWFAEYNCWGSKVYGSG